MITLNDQELKALISEDVPYGDLTTKSLGIDAQRARIIFATRDRPLVASCTEEAVRLCELYGLEIDGFIKSGTLVPPKSIFLTATGGISVKNIAKYASTRVDMIVTSSPYSTRPADIKVRIEPL